MYLTNVNNVPDVALPVFYLRDTESSHGRYSNVAKMITFEDLVKFHGHACDGLYRGVYALSVGLKKMFGDKPIDRTDLRVISRNSPCIGDAASYLTGARIRFGTQDVDSIPGVWYIIQRISNGQTVKVVEDEAFFPDKILKAESNLTNVPKEGLSKALDELKLMQDQWVKQVLLKTQPYEHYHADYIEFVWKDVEYTKKGKRTDIIFKDVI